MQNSYMYLVIITLPQGMGLCFTIPYVISRIQNIKSKMHNTV